MNNSNTLANYKHWEEIEGWAADESRCSWDACILELRSRVEDLEAENTELRIRLLRLSNAIARQLPDKTKFFIDLMPDHEDDQ